MTQNPSNLYWPALLAAVLVSGPAYCEESDAAKTLAEAYPGLTSGALSSARLGDLPADTLLKSEDVTVSRDDMQTEIAGAPANLREEQILASRYGIQSIPTRLFFDKNGREVSRHVGFFAQAEMEKKLSEMGTE